MQVHSTKGIVLKSVKYGDTSLITTLYTELFGIQSYLVRGVRQSSKKTQGKAMFFMPATMLELQVHHNPLKNLQFIKEFQFGHIYQQLPYSVIKNAVAMYVVEMLEHCLKEPEANPELFYLLEDTLLATDTGNDASISNMPLFFTLQLASQLGFQLQGTYSPATPILDLQEGIFTPEKPLHPFYAEAQFAQTIGQINLISTPHQLQQIKLNRDIRRRVLHYLQQYVSLHIQDFKEIKSLTVMQEVLN